MNIKAPKLKQGIYISLLLLMVIMAGGIKAQVVPWTVIPTSNSQEVVIEKLDSTVSYDFSFSTIGDAIGVFYDQSGTWVCAGYLQLDGVTRTFQIYGNDAVDNGFQNLEMFHLKYWRKSQNCIISMPSAGMSNAQYSTGGSDTINVLGAFPAIVDYPKHYYCKYNTSVLPIPLQISGTTFGNLSFDTDPSLGFMSGVDGSGNIVDFNAITSGTYTFYISTLDNMCLRYDSLIMTVSEKLESSPVINITQPDCAAPKGTVALDTATIIHGAKPYTFSLKDTLSGAVIPSASGLFSNLRPAGYHLIIQDQETCADTFKISVNPYQGNCDDVSDILTPFQNPEFAEVYLPWSGLTRIYNSQGQLINTFTTPAVWDGKDQNGQYVKTGAYFIFTDGKKKKEITVIY